MENVEKQNEQPLELEIEVLEERIAPDATGLLQLQEAALDLADGLADLGGEGAVTGPAVVLEAGPVLDHDGDEGLGGGAEIGVGEDGVEPRVVGQRRGAPAGP